MGIQSTGEGSNTTQTTEEYIKLTTSFTGNFTAFHAYMDGFHAEGMHGATHMVCRSGYLFHG
jgi:hypothetical protein